MQQIEKHLKDHSIQYNTDKNGVWLTMPGERCVYDIGFSAEDELKLICMFIDFDIVIPSKHRLKAAEFIIRINNDLLLGYFTLDMEEGFVQFKLPNLLNNCDLTDEFTKDMITHGIRSVDEAYDGFLAIIEDGGKSPEEAYKLTLAEMDAVETGN